MRLTLRTLLAYMDDILDPADQENLAKQVEESENATELLHRTRDAMRRLRLGAPPVIGDGMDIDPNVAAEYLDSTMSAEDMSEYQQVCIDSDVHLAEVASCHHILTMVLGEPAEIEPAMKERMYDIPSRVDEWRKLRLDAPHRMANSAPATEPEPAKTDDKPTPKSVADKQAKPEVPEYLKASDSSRYGRMGLIFAVFLLLGFGVVVLFGPGGILTSDDDQNTPVAEGGPGAEDDLLGGVEPGEPEDDTSTEPSDISVPADPVDVAAPPADTTGESEDFELPEITGLDTPPSDGTTDEPAPEVEDPTDLPGPEEGDTAIEPEVGDTEAGGDEGEVEGDTEPRVAMAPEATGVEEGVTDLTAAEPVDDTVAGPIDPMPMGTCVSPQQVLLRWDEGQSEWLRVPGRSSVYQGDQLMALPTYRPSLMLVSGLRVELSDGTALGIDFTEDGTTPQMQMTYGRFLLQNTGMQKLEVELAIGGEVKRVALEPRVVLGVEVDRPFMPGADVENSLGAFRAMVYAPSGNIVWNVGDAAAMPVEDASQWEWHDNQVASLTDDVEWLDSQQLDILQRNVSNSFESRMDTESSARLQLLEFYESSRRREEKAFASLSALQVGQFIPFVQALADSQQQSNWDEQITQLRQAMSRSTQAAKLVHETLTEQRGAALADDLFAMLRGYSAADIGSTPEEVKSGITRQLINWLEHDRLEYRVLAIHNLKEIYGGKTLSYNPVVTEPSRQQRAVRMWRTRLADNELEPEDR